MYAAAIALPPPTGGTSECIAEPYSHARVPSGSGWARHTGGCTQRRPWRSSGRRANTGDAAAAG
ncbi:MAG TPA: hypothetical protein VK778_09430 [Solirubrobacteraceae bacterium]|jgi:hypothetical protein|nr:hypothetical protein [Solirubrobacteraceae bacterium]